MTEGTPTVALERGTSMRRGRSHLLLATPLGWLRWLTTAAAIAGAVLRLGLRPLSWRRPVRAEFLRFMELAGVRSLPAVVVAGMLIGAALVGQGIYWSAQLGDQTTVFEVIVTVLIREIAPLVVGLLAIGRGGLLILDELSNMQRGGQCRALDAQGADPFLVFVMPRVLALSISVFCLAMVFIVVALVTGYAMATALGVSTIPIQRFVSQMLATIGSAGYIVLPAKSLGMGLVVGVICSISALEPSRPSDIEQDLIPIGFLRSVLAVFLVSGLVSVL